MRGYSASPAPLSATESATAAAAAHVPARLRGGRGSQADSFHDGFHDVMDVRVRRWHAPHRGRPGPGMLLRGTTTAL